MQPNHSETKMITTGGMTSEVDFRDLLQRYPVTSTLPSDTPLARSLIISIIRAGEHATEDLIGQVIDVGHLIVHVCQGADQQTGELRDWSCVTFPQTDGPPVYSGAKGVFNSIADLCYATGKTPPWDPPLRCRVKRKSIGGGKHTIYLVWEP